MEIIINSTDYLNPNFNYEGEEWKDIIGYEGKYQISNCGRVKSLERIKYNKRFKTKSIRQPMILKAQTNKFGYYYIILTKISKQTTTKIHRLVGTHFIPFIVNKNQLNHIDGIKHNNYTSNLEWCTASENQLHAIKKGLVIRKYGISSKFKEIDIQNIFELDKTMMRKDIAEKYNVCRSTISEILNRNNWIMANIP